MDGITLTSKLNQKTELWGMVPFLNELNEYDIKEGKIKDIYVQIFQNYQGGIKDTKITEYAEVTHKIRCRRLSVPKPSKDMFFLANGIKYETLYFDVDHKNREFWEFQVKIVIE